MIALFGVPIHQASGEVEADAECALLQQEGIVDAVLREYVEKGASFDEHLSQKDANAFSYLPNDYI